MSVTPLNLKLKSPFDNSVISLIYFTGSKQLLKVHALLFDFSIFRLAFSQGKEGRGVGRERMIESLVDIQI